MKYTREEQVAAWVNSKPREKTASFQQLLDIVKDPLMAELMWVHYGEHWDKTIDSPIKALNPPSGFWHFLRKKNTIRSLLQTDDGREAVWRMLEEAGAWL